MAYYGILTAIIISIIVGCIGFFIGVKLGNSEGYVEGMEDGLERGKQVYYLEPKEHNLEEAKKLSTYIKGLQQKPGITAEMLMAYGVESTRELPKGVRESFGLDEYSNDTYLDTLLREEVTHAE